ncbi:MAG: redoxin domain-containing protein [Deltaproteobacteria bacterium]|nr:redoxin domain-containing protein [Deltaproteobacteria bacterium]
MKTAISIFAALALLFVRTPSSWGVEKRLLDNAGVQGLAQEAPDFTLTDRSGRSTGLKESRGKVVILHLWATWCRPCREEFPLFEKMFRRFKDKGVVFFPVAIDRDARAQDVRSLAKEYGASFEVYLAKEGAITERYWSFGVPETYFIDKNGVIVARAIGPRDWGSEGVAALINGLGPPGGE